MAKRPDHLKPPAYLSKSPPVPCPDPIEARNAAATYGAANSVESPENGEKPLDPTRYGDWEKRGIAIDF